MTEVPKYSQVKATKDYDLFKLIPGNRKPNPNHVRELKDKIFNQNLLYVKPMIVIEDENDGKMLILDGQHRLLAAQELNAFIYYQVLFEKDIDMVQVLKELNLTADNWGLKDYLHSYIVLGNEHYIRIREFIDNNQPLNISPALQLLGGYSIKPSAGLAEFKKGYFKVQGEKLRDAQLLINNIRTLEPYMEKNMWSMRWNIAALQIIYNEQHRTRAGKMMRVTPDDLVRRLKKYTEDGTKNKIRPAGEGYKGYLAQYADAYNKGIREENIIDAFTIPISKKLEEFEETDILN